MRKSKKPRDLAQMAKAIVDEATDENPPKVKPDDDGKNPAAVALGKLGGAKGGRARAKKMTKKQRSEAARKAARVRWKNRRIKQGD